MFRSREEANSNPSRQEGLLYSYEKFDPAVLSKKKEQKGLRVAVVIPALNEEETIGRVIDMIQGNLMTPGCLLVDEILVVDSGSTDGTGEEVVKRSVAFLSAENLLSDIPPIKGKGENLWRSLAATTADLIVFLDADPKNPHPGYVYGLLGPLIMGDDIVFVKSFFNRKTNGGNKQQKPQAGGRVTELTARPIFNLLFPELFHIIQPYNGNVAGRREILIQLSFPTKYGVDLSMVIDIAMRWGPNRIAQVFCGEFEQEGQSLKNLGRMAFQGLRAVLRKAKEYNRLQLLSEDLSSTLRQPVIGKNGIVVWETIYLDEKIRSPIKDVLPK